MDPAVVNTPKKAAPLRSRDLQIVYEDPDLVVINKPTGYAVHKGWDQGAPLLPLVRGRVRRRLYPVHRLDRPTSGVLVFAKSSEVAARVQHAFRHRHIDKRYWAIVRGVPPDVGHIDHPIPRVKDGPRVPAVSRFVRLYDWGRYALVEVQPLTGRLHQVRRHLKHISHPIIGDVRYGKGDHNRHWRQHYRLHRLALHAVRLTLPHPRTGLSLALYAPLPPDFAEALAQFGVPDDILDAIQPNE
ncbi:MAG: pseudouridine synthase [Myxococcota bacterium]